jgi:L-ribulokinase
LKYVKIKLPGFSRAYNKTTRGDDFMGNKYVIGVDFGTLSGRTLVAEVGTGNELAVAVSDYRHGVMDEYLPDGKTKLEPDWALQHPGDYLEVLSETIPRVMKEAGIKPADVIGVGIDFTACTMLPIDKGGVPLCFHEEFKSEPHSYVKLWKHHAA